MSKSETAEEATLVTAWRPPPWWHIGWHLRYMFRDAGDLLDDQWLKEMRIPPRSAWPR